MGVILLGLVAGLAWGLGDFLAGVASRRVRVMHALVLSQVVALVAVLLALALSGDPAPPLADLRLGLAAGVCEGIAFVAFFRALAIGTMSLVAPVAAVGAVIPVGVAVAGGEHLGPLALGGGGVALVAAALVARAPGPASRRGLGLAALSALGFGGFLALIAPAAETSPLWAVGASRIGALTVVVVAAAIARAPSGIPLRAAWPAAAAGLLDGGANLAFATGTRHGQISVVVVLASLYPLATVAMARLVLREPLGRQQWLGIGAALAGIGLIAVG